MFNPAIQSKLLDAWQTALSLLAQNEIVWTQAKPPNTTATFIAAVRWAGSDDAELVNAYGPGGLLVVADARHFPLPPVKFDQIQSGPRRFTVMAAHERIVSDQASFYQLYCTGK